MVKSIYKYAFDMFAGEVLGEATQTISVRKGFEFLHAGMADDFRKIWIWGMVDLDADAEDRTFRIFMTGETIPDKELEDAHYLGTTRMKVAHGEELVSHLFDITGVSG